MGNDVSVKLARAYTDDHPRCDVMDSSYQPKNFPTTLWTVVLHAGRDEPAQVQAALAQLCQAYWYPLYSFVRRRGYSPHDAEDLTQAFFAQLLEKRGLERVDPELGRFRTFLLASLKNFLANDWDKAHARKRGGGQTIVSLDRGECRIALSTRTEPRHDSRAPLRATVGHDTVWIRCSPPCRR